MALHTVHMDFKTAEEVLMSLILKQKLQNIFNELFEFTLKQDSYACVALAQLVEQSMKYC